MAKKRPPKFNPENPYEDPPANPFAAADVLPPVAPEQVLVVPQKAAEAPAKVVPGEELLAAIRILQSRKDMMSKKATIGLDILKASASDEDSVVHFTDHTFLVEAMGYIESVQAAADDVVRFLKESS